MAEPESETPVIPRKEPAKGTGVPEAAHEPNVLVRATALRLVLLLPCGLARSRLDHFIRDPYTLALVYTRRRAARRAALGPCHLE